MHGLSVNVLFMLAQSSGISEVHPKLCRTSWEALVCLSEKGGEDGKPQGQNRDADFENFIPKFIQILKTPSTAVSRAEIAMTVETKL